MSFRRILFVGLGGAGQRQLRILRGLVPGAELFAYRRTSATPLLRADFTVAPAGSLESEYGITVLPSLEQAMAAKPDLTVISTPTAMHREPMMRAMQAGSGVLVEKPWAESLEGFREFRDGMRRRGSPFAISFQRRFHPMVARARELLRAGRIGTPVSATFHVESNVRVWHPYEDWTQLYAVRRELGGGVLLTEIHEIDLAHWFFGAPTRVHCHAGTWSGEPIDVEDAAQLTLEYPSMSAQVSLNFLHPIQNRGFHIAGTTGALAWDAASNQLTIDAAGQPRATENVPTTNDEMFVRQATKLVAGWSRSDTEEQFQSAEVSLAVVEAARRSMRSGRAEPLELAGP